MFEFFVFRKVEEPPRVPPVPVAIMMASTFPSVCSQISGPGKNILFFGQNAQNFYLLFQSELEDYKDCQIDL
jgi:hypothetical protein